MGVIAVQNVQQGLHPLRVRGLHTKINPLPGDGGGLRFLRRDVLFRTLVPQVLVVLVVHPGLGGVGKVPLLHIHIRIAHPNQIAPVHLHGGVEQAEAPGDQRDGQEDHATPLDGLLEIQVALVVDGIVLVQVKYQGAVYRLVHIQQHGLPGNIGVVGHAQIPAHASEDSAGHIQIAAGPEGHGVVRQRQHVFVDCGEIHRLRRPRRDRRQLEHQQQAQQQCRELSSHHVLPSAEAPLEEGSTVTPV